MDRTNETANADWSLNTAELLHELRTSRGLTPQKLSDEIKKECGVSISADSLSNYEVTYTQNHSRSYKTKGMKIEFLRALSKYYGISTDYLLGISDIPCINPDMKSAMKFTGLSESAIQMIKVLQQENKSPRGIEILNLLLSAPQFTLSLIGKLHYYLICTEAYHAAKNKREHEVSKLYEITQGDVIKEIQLRESGEIDITLSVHDIDEYENQKDIAELRVVRQFNEIKDQLEKHYANIKLCNFYSWEEGDQ